MHVPRVRGKRGRRAKAVTELIEDRMMHHVLRNKTPYEFIIRVRINPKFWDPNSVRLRGAANIWMEISHVTCTSRSTTC